ncbi:TonB-dependent receptor [Brevundimonas sp. SORGH_AS_0993]|uniref:TonB-dependent receptor n=1 Tax=Brevundimonas sp. SORGH_AS_0993 TaxID=3041794 RepID=UPI002782761B|nr:TonB-dependent receptor [Brevundimonas sp. SORGH_AS_0993]MDQ1153643.1 iron complex outermembrane receptor protein [Brevundimonas sp. SORGH_AS_0993]
MRRQVHMNASSRLLLLLSASTLCLAPTAAFAFADPTADPTTAPDPQSTELTDIVVTAERRSVDLQKAPIAVTAVTAETLAQANITNVTGLNGTVPGLVVARSGGGELMVAIRGIGSETPENTNTQPGVSYHVDGVYIFNSIAASAAFIDVAQVEILRGPQGTMFGQGSTGGTINVVTNQPELGRYGGAFSLGAGNYDLVKSSAALNVPIGDQFAIRGAIQTLKHDGYADATGVSGTDRYPLDQADEVGWKVAGLWAPRDDLSFTLGAIHFDSNTNGPAQKNILDPEPNPRLLTQDYPGKSVVETTLYSGVVKWELPWATFKSISSYQKLHSIQAWDADGLTTSLFYGLTYDPRLYSGTRYDHVPLWQSDTKSWTQEFNFASNTDGPFRWIGGVVYLKSKNAQYVVEYRGSDTNITRPALARNSAWNDPAVASVTYADLSEVERESWAAYFQGAYTLTDHLTLTAGLRYNSDDYSGASDNYSGGVSKQTSGSHLQPSPRPGLSTEEVTGKLSLDYQFTPTNLLYASYTRGYKPGGLNGASDSGTAWQSIKATYQPETVDSFEIGSKNRFHDNTIQLNASAFLYDYKNMQFLEEDPVLYYEGTSNAPSAQIYGLELEGSWLVTPKWRFDGSLSFTKGEFDEDYYALDPVAATKAQSAAGYPGYLFWANYYRAALARNSARANINGNDVPKIPRRQGAISTTYSDTIAGGYFTAKLEYVYRGQYTYRLYNEASTDIVPSYSVVNAFLRYEPDGANWNVSLSGTNLFDKEGLNSRFSDPYGSAQVSDTYVPPRQWIASVGYKF